MFIDKISSVQNPKIKDIIALQEKSKERKTRGLFIVEGKRELNNCFEGGFSMDSIFFCEDYIKEQNILSICQNQIINDKNGLKLYSVSKNVYNKIAYRDRTEGVVAIIKENVHTLNDIRLGKNPLILILESVEKPGNLGAVLRTADAAGVDAILICDPLTDLYNPNLIRASIGGIFTKQVVTCTSQEAYSWLKANHISILTAQLQDSEYYYDTDMTVSVAIVLGTESKGLTKFWKDASDTRICIPMLGKLDSLNVSVSAAILCYEAVRQRQKNIDK